MPSSTFFHLPEAKREKLLLAAREEFARVPYDEASINRMIRAAGIPRGSFYMYFDGKDDLFRYLLEDSFQQVIQKLRALLQEKQGDLFGAFRGLFDCLLETRQQGSSSVEALSAMLRLNAGVQQGPLLRSIDPSRLMESILPEIDCDRLSLQREGDLEEIVFILISITMPMIWSALDQDVDLIREHYLARLDILSRGMAAKSAAML